MPELKLNLKEETVAEPVAVIKKNPFKQKIACYWEIKATTKNGYITARSNMGDTYEGTISEFNKRLRE